MTSRQLLPCSHYIYNKDKTYILHILGVFIDPCNYSTDPRVGVVCFSELSGMLEIITGDDWKLLQDDLYKRRLFASPFRPETETSLIKGPWGYSEL